VAAALYVFIAFYVTCVAVNWWYYARRNAEIPIRPAATAVPVVGPAAAAAR
jgi:nitrate/nitrite transporter NarK